MIRLCLVPLLLSVLNCLLGRDRGSPSPPQPPLGQHDHHEQEQHGHHCHDHIKQDDDNTDTTEADGDPDPLSSPANVIASIHRHTPCVILPFELSRHFPQFGSRILLLRPQEEMVTLPEVVYPGDTLCICIVTVITDWDILQVHLYHDAASLRPLGHGADLPAGEGRAVVDRILWNHRHVRAASSR